MKSEYEYIMIVEVEAGTDKEEKEALKRFKSELYAKYGYTASEVMISEIKRV